jgi:hypothetical protein
MGEYDELGRAPDEPDEPETGEALPLLPDDGE